ncbi:hypothetical protein B7486_38530 [cyanobacterium TDX16]|nr:hypothetical protein B7486_38530 [cyanobacterium TDX16]
MAFVFLPTASGYPNLIIAIYRAQLFLLNFFLLILIDSKCSPANHYLKKFRFLQAIASLI